MARTPKPVTAQDLYASWFKNRKWKTFPYQQEVMDRYLAGYGGLLNAPTGSGKTMALWLPVITDWMARNGNQPIAKKGGLKAIWITPVKALANDITRALQQACDELGCGWRVEQRTGDTSLKDRAKQKTNVPQCLVTTPESLHLLMGTKGYPDFFSGLEVFIVDEWHELLGNKRGVQVELALSRLRALMPSLRVWGISATIGNLEEGLDVLLGMGEREAPKTIVKAELDKTIVVESIIPEEVESYPWGGHLGIKMLPQIIPILQASKTTLIFTNTRAQCEIWYMQLIEQYPELAGLVALHHGSLDASVRAWVEEALHKGSLKAVVCTSSLDLGVDYRPVETIIQIGGPKGVARFLQRAGRSGHTPGAISKIYFVPANSLELIEAAALRTAIQTGQVEAKTPLANCYDVLAQYLVTLSLGEGFEPVALYQEIKRTYCYQYLEWDDFQQIMDFVTYGGPALKTYEEFSRVRKEEEGGLYKISSRKLALLHRLNIGTITATAVVSVRFLKGGYIGSIEEYFVSRLKAGDVFAFGGKILEFVQMKDMSALVKLGKNKKNIQVPSWQGGRMPLSSQLSRLIREKLSEATQNTAPSSIEMQRLAPLFDRQRSLSVIPHEDEFLIEQIETRDGYHLFFFTFEGRLVNEGMAALLAWRIGQRRAITFSISMTDYGFELLSDQKIDAEELLEEDLLSPKNLVYDITQGVNASELATRKFRDIAQISGMVPTNRPGKELKARHLQASSQLFFQVFSDYEPENLFLRQAYEEVLSQQLEESRLRTALERIATQKIVIQRPGKPTPFSFPIMVERIRSKHSTERIEDRIEKLIAQLDT